jgi:predicted ATPase
VATRKPLAFISYHPVDDNDGFVDQLAKALEHELHALQGETFRVFHYRNVKPGDSPAAVQRHLEDATFLIPILTPRYFQSDLLRAQLQHFLEREEQRQTTLIVPVYFNPSSTDFAEDPLAKNLRAHRFIDWRALRSEPFQSPRVLRRVSDLAKALVAAQEPWSIERLQLSNFRCFARLDLEFQRQSTLDGDWTCLAGVNGAGKSSILQALCIALLGGQALELGGGMLGRMRRADMAATDRTEISLTLSRGGQKSTRSVQIGSKGLLRTESPGVAHALIALGYGATRNLGAEQDSPFKNMSEAAQRIIGLFYPLAQLSCAEVLLSDRRRRPALLPLFTKLIGNIFEQDIAVVEGDRGAIEFTVLGKDRIEALDLPDGFRSSAAWLADLCATWCEQHPDATTVDPADIRAIVLIDEIDLHLHPALQRTLVPRLRKALPKVQWIVTTHSPLVLANFDANEIVALDRNVEGNVRPLDRQIMGFTTDQIYDWLMGTSPTGAAMEQLLRDADRGKADRDAVATLMRTSPEHSDAEARKRLAEFKDILKSLKG